MLSQPRWTRDRPAAAKSHLPAQGVRAGDGAGVRPAQPPTLVIGLRRLRHVHGQLAAEGVHAHHARVRGGVAQRGDLVVIARDAVQRLRDISCPLQDDFLGWEGRLSPEALLCRKLLTPGSPAPGRHLPQAPPTPGPTTPPWDNSGGPQLGADWDKCTFQWEMKFPWENNLKVLLGLHNVCTAHPQPTGPSAHRESELSPRPLSPLGGCQGVLFPVRGKFCFQSLALACPPLLAVSTGAPRRQGGALTPRPRGRGGVAGTTAYLVVMGHPV